MRYSRFVRRIAVTGEASVRSCATEDSEDGTLLDVSRKGARLCINRLFRPGQKLTLMMNLLLGRAASWKCVSLRSSGYTKTLSALNFLKVETDDRVLLDVFPRLSIQTTSEGEIRLSGTISRRVAGRFDLRLSHPQTDSLTPHRPSRSEKVECLRFSPALIRNL